MNLLLAIDRYWQTVRYLKPVQIYGRLWFRWVRPRINLDPAPVLTVASGLWQLPASRNQSLIGPQNFLFLGEEGDLSEIGWDGSARNKLWRYNQHYFDDLNSQNSESRAIWHKNLLNEWVRSNPPGYGTGWDSYTTSLRIVNWIKWSLAGNLLPTVCLLSLAVQARWLKKRLEIHLLGNHLFANAKALIFAGLFFDGEEANDWLDIGLKILDRELPEQILGDGGHFERTTMYHALALEDILDLCNVAKCFNNRFKLNNNLQIEQWCMSAIKMHSWLLAMSHPDGEIAFFNDAAFDIAPRNAALKDYAARLFPSLSPTPLDPIFKMLESGYIRLTQKNAVALIDVAEVGPDYLPGHAHADTLSFELSVGLQRVLVNSGTSCYGSDAERRRQRSTKAHNTVAVDGFDSSEVWAGFRVARRARPFDLQIEAVNEYSKVSVSCAHDGYCRLPGHPIHRRSWILTHENLIIQDVIEGKHGFAEAMFHFHPSLDINKLGGAAGGEVTLQSKHVLSWNVEVGEARIEPSTWHPRFGSSEPNLCLIVKLRQGVSNIRFSWAKSAI